jgi:hypothetical protein
MDTPAEHAENVMTSPLTDVRSAPLGKVTGREILNRLRPNAAKVVVAAFNSSI